MNTPKPATRAPMNPTAAGGLRRNRRSARGPTMARATTPGSTTSDAEHPALPGRQAELVLEVEVQEQRDAEEGEAEGRHPGQEEVEGADLAQPLEGDAERDRAARPRPRPAPRPSTACISLRPRRGSWMRARPRTTGMPRSDSSEEDPAPALGPGDQRRRCRRRRAARGPGRPTSKRAVGGEHPRPGRDRVGVHQQRGVHRQGVGLADAGAEPGDEQPEGALHEAGERTPRRPTRAIETAAISLRGCRSASVLSGIEPSRNSTPKAPPMAPMTASDTPRLSWMSGASTASAVLSIAVDQPGEADGHERGGTAGPHGLAAATSARRRRRAGGRRAGRPPPRAPARPPGGPPPRGRPPRGRRRRPASVAAASLSRRPAPARPAGRRTPRRRRCSRRGRGSRRRRACPR